MNKFELRTTVDVALDQMKNSISSKSLKAYRSTGFGGIIRYYKGKGIQCVNIEMLDEYLQEMNQDYCKGLFSDWKWEKLRRSCEILKIVMLTGSAELKRLRPWDKKSGKAIQSITQDTPSQEQLSTPDNIFMLAWKTRQALQQNGFTENSIKHYTSEGISLIIRRHREIGTEKYSKQVAEEVVSEKRKQYENGETSRQSYQNVRKAAALIEDMFETGDINLEKLVNRNLRIPNDHFAEVLEKFCGTAKRDGYISAGTVSTARSAVRQFLFTLEENGIYSISDISFEMVNSSVTKMALKYTSGFNSAKFCIKLFLIFLFEYGFTESDYSKSLPATVAVRKKYHEGFEKEEVDLLLSQPDKNTGIGKRDYAIMILALQTGLRACDVVELKRENIDWHNRSINIVQHKTGSPLSVPLTPEAGNAIADYLLHGRPVCNLSYIFICHSGKKRPIKSRSASAIVGRYMEKIKILDSSKRRGFHSFRRTFGTSLLKGGVKCEMIEQLLGHTDMNSMKPYLSVDEQGLKMCALPLVSNRRKETEK